MSVGGSERWVPCALLPAWRCAVSPAYRRAVPAGGRRSKPFPRFCGMCGTRFRGAARRGAGLKAGAPFLALARLGEVVVGVVLEEEGHRRGREALFGAGGAHGLAHVG